MSLAELAAASAAWAAGASEPTEYLCVGDGTAGLSIEGGQPGSPGLGINERWLLAEVIAKADGPDWSAGDKVWQLSREGSKGIKTVCTDWGADANPEKARGEIVLCRGVYDMVFNKESLLFVLTYSRGYVVGRCSAQ